MGTQKDYERKFMSRVFYMQDGKLHDALFETEEAAKVFFDAMEAAGCKPTHNKWRWEVRIEE